MSSDCCTWRRGAPNYPNDIFIPESSGSAGADRTECCKKLLKDTSACCDTGTIPDDIPQDTSWAGWYDDDRISRASPAVTPVVPSQVSDSDVDNRTSPVTDPRTFPSQSQTVTIKDVDARPTPPTPHGAEPEYVGATNKMRGTYQHLKWNSNLERTAESIVSDIFLNNCLVPSEEDVGINTFAMKGCHKPCTWPDIDNSWAAEKGNTTCQVAHRVTLLNPHALSVGCAMQNQGSCLAAVCAYDQGAPESTALSVSVSQPTPMCDRNVCCGALPCTNTLC